MNSAVWERFCSLRGPVLTLPQRGRQPEFAETCKLTPNFGNCFWAKSKDPFDHHLSTHPPGQRAGALAGVGLALDPEGKKRSHACEFIRIEKHA